MNRILYQHNGRMDISSETYRIIEDLVLQKHFYQFHFEFCKLSVELEIAVAEIKEKDSVIKTLETSLKELQQELENAK